MAASTASEPLVTNHAPAYPVQAVSRSASRSNDRSVKKPRCT